jgi:basic membrane protein A and related proteins
MRTGLSTLLAAACLIFSCCRQAEAPARPHPAFKVGLLTPGSIDDNGWNAVAWDGLQRIRTSMRAEISHQEAKTPAEFEQGFRFYGSHRFDLAFGHGFEFQDAALSAGKEYPDTIFITTSGSSVAKNVAPMVFELEQATYLLGIIAARESRTGKAGVVGGIRLPSIDSTFTAFRAGARSVNPNFEVAEIYTGNFDDVGAAKLATLSLINARCDFIFHQCNEAGRGVFQACSERRIRCFGSNKNQNDLAPDTVLASAVLDVPSAFVKVAQTVRDRTFRPRAQRFGMREGIVSLVWNENLKPTISPATVAAVDAAQKQIIDGSLVVPHGQF